MFRFTWVIEKGRDLTHFYDKSPFTNRNKKKNQVTTQTRHKKFNYTAIAYRLRAVSLSNYSQQTGVVTCFTGLTFPLHSQKLFKKKDTHTCLNSPNRDRGQTANGKEEVLKMQYKIVFGNSISKYLVTSVRVCCSPPICKRAQVVEGLKEFRLIIIEDEDQDHDAFEEVG